MGRRRRQKPIILVEEQSEEERLAKLPWDVHATPESRQPSPQERLANDFLDEEAQTSRRHLPKILGGIALAVVALALFLLRPLGPAATPEKSVRFVAADQSFSCLIPTNWTSTPLGRAAPGGGAFGNTGIEVTSGGARMEVTFSTVKGLMTGQLLMGNDLSPGANPGESRALTVAELQKKGYIERYKSYQETQEPMCPSGMAGTVLGKDKRFKPDAVLFSFRANGPSLRQRGEIQGYRAAVAGRFLVAAVTCSCDTADWERLKPAFLAFIEGVREERPQGIDDPMPFGSPLGSRPGTR
jgi:hypothetical protein